MIRIFETEINFNKYNWISRCLNEEEKQPPARLQKPSKCRLYATEPILPGVVEFLFDLLDSNGVRVTKATKASHLKEFITILGFQHYPTIRRNISETRFFYKIKLAKKLLANLIFHRYA